MMLVMVLEAMNDEGGGDGASSGHSDDPEDGNDNGKVMMVKM